MNVPVRLSDPKAIDRALTQLSVTIAAARAAKANGSAPLSMRFYRQASDVASDLLVNLSIAGDEARAVSSQQRGPDGAGTSLEDGEDVICIRTIEEVARAEVKEVEVYLHEAKTLLDFGYKNDALESYDYAIETAENLLTSVRHTMMACRTGKPIMVRTVRDPEAGAASACVTLLARDQ